MIYPFTCSLPFHFSPLSINTRVQSTPRTETAFSQQPQLNIQNTAGKGSGKSVQLQHTNSCSFQQDAGQRAGVAIAGEEIRLPEYVHVYFCHNHRAVVSAALLQILKSAA